MNNPRDRHRAAFRSSPWRYLFRELMARPSASRTIQVPDQPPDDGKLLVILLPEDRHVRLSNV
jgi:hypothetical protein